MQTKDQNITSNPLSTLSVTGQVLHKAIYLGLFSLKQLMILRLLNSELKKIVGGFLRSSPVAIEMLYDFLYAEFLYSHHLSYYRKEQFVLFQQFCERLDVKEAWRTSQNTITRLLVGMLEDSDIIIDRPQSGLEVMLDGAQERRTAQFPKGKKVFADNAQLLFDELVFSISLPKKMFILVAACNFLGVKKDDLISLNDHQKVLFEMLTTKKSPTFFKPYYNNPTELLTSVCVALPEEKYGDLMAYAMFSALLSLTVGKARMKWDLGPIYFNLCGIDFSKNDFSDSMLTGANFFNSDLRGAVFHDKDLSLTNLSGIWDLCLCDFSRANLRGTLMRDANLSRSVFNDADLSEADLRGANFNKNDDMEKINFWRANLRGASFAHLSLTGSSFREANLSRAKLQQVYVEDVDFNGANLCGATLGLGELKKMKKLTIGPNFKKTKLINYGDYIEDLVDGLLNREDLVSTGGDIIFALKIKHLDEIADGLTSENINSLRKIALDCVMNKFKTVKCAIDALTLWELLCRKNNILFYKNDEIQTHWFNIIELFVAAHNNLANDTDVNGKDLQKLKENLLVEIELNCTGPSTSQFFQPSDPWPQLKYKLLEVVPQIPLHSLKSSIS